MKTDTIIDISRDTFLHGVIVKYCSLKREKYSLQDFLERASDILSPDKVSYGLARRITQAGSLLAYLGVDHSALKTAGVEHPLLSGAIAKQKATSIKPAPRAPKPPAPRLKRLIRI